VLIKRYKDTNITYQGSYEYDFLEKFYKIFPDIKNGLSFNYYFDNKIRIYYSDFFIPSLNLIVEIKNSYLFNKCKEEIISKESAVRLAGYDYIIIIDKHYKRFKQTYVKFKE